MHQLNWIVGIEHTEVHCRNIYRLAAAICTCNQLGDIICASIGWTNFLAPIVEEIVQHGTKPPSKLKLLSKLYTVPVVAILNNDQAACERIGPKSWDADT